MYILEFISLKSIIRLLVMTMATMKAAVAAAAMEEVGLLNTCTAVLLTILRITVDMAEAVAMAAVVAMGAAAVTSEAMEGTS